MPLVITKDPASGKTNVGMYRMQVYDRNTTGMHWQKHKDGAGQARGYEREGRRMEVAVAIGCDPATVFSAIAPLPPGLSEFLFAGFLRGEGVPLTAGKTVDLLVPGRSGDRARGIRRSGRVAPRGAVRRPHRLLLAGRRLSGLPRDRRDAARAPDLPDDDRRPPADGGRLHGRGRRAALPAARQEDDPRDRGHAPAGRGHLPQPDDRRDRQAVSGACAQDDARDLGDGADDVHEDDRRRRQGRRRPGRRRSSSGGR